MLVSIFTFGTMMLTAFVNMSIDRARGEQPNTPTTAQYFIGWIGLVTVLILKSLEK